MVVQTVIAQSKRLVHAVARHLKMRQGTIRSEAQTNLSYQNTSMLSGAGGKISGLLLLNSIWSSSPSLLQLYHQFLWDTLR